MKCTLLALSVFGLLSPPLSAQTLNTPSSWTFDHSAGGFCLWYLVEPAIAAKLAPKGAVLQPAGRGEGLLPAVARQVQDEPEFGRWIPASICIGLYDTVTVNDERVAQKKQADRPIILVTHSFAASSFRGSQVQAVVVGFYTDNSGVARAADHTGQVVDDVKLTRLPTRDDSANWLIEFAKVKLHWQGSPGGESRVLPTRTVSFGYVGQRGNIWGVALEESGQQGRTLYGSIGVEGKSDLAKALAASPIRQLGPMESVGKVTLRFAILQVK